MDKAKFAYTVPEAAAAVGLGRSKLYEMMKAGEVRSFRIGTRRLIAAEELAELVERKRHECAA